MSGPTVAGSIVAKLRLDSGTWDADLAAAEARADELGRHDPHIKVDVDAAAALAKLEEVRAAASATGGDVRGPTARPSMDFHAELERVQANALADAMAKLDAVTAGLEAAQAADNEEMRQGSLLALRESINMEALAAAEDKASKAALEHAAADDVQAKAAGTAANLNSANVTRIGLIIAAIAVLVTVLAPLAGYALGVSGALAGMGAAGVLAIIGIKNAMSDASDMGQSYSSGLQSLKGDLNQLAGTAAVGMLSAFKDAVAQINDAMPQLNTQISGFSTVLGTVGNSLLSGVISSFRILNPLFVQAGQYVEDLAAGFQAWTSNGGLQKFALYAQQALPQVAQTLGSLVTAALHLVDALTPIGTVVLAGLKGFGDFLAGIPSGVLVDLATGAGAFFIAFQGWAALTPIIQGVAVAIGAVGAAEDLALGPIGLVIAAVTSIAAIFAVSAVSTGQASAATVAYTSALQTSNGAIDESIRKTVAKQLSDEGALQTAKKYHLDLSTVTDAVLGNAAAQKTVTDSTRIFGQTMYTTTGAAGQMGQQVKGLSLEGKNFLATVTGQTGALHDSVQAFKDQAAAAAGTSAVTSQAATDLGITQQSYQDLSTAVDLATNASRSWKAEQDLINGVAQTVEGANITLSQSFTTMAATIASNIKSAGATAATSMDINTQYGAQNHQMILTQVQDAEAAAAAQVAADLKAGKSHADTAADASKFLADQKQKIEDQAVAAGLDRGTVQTLLDTIDQLKPKDIKLSVETAAALQDVQTLLANLAAVPAYKRTSIGVDVQYNNVPPAFIQPVKLPSAGGTIYKAAGGAIDAAYLAAGGRSPYARGTDTVPAMLTPGEFVIKEKSASYDPGFLKAYNSDPAAAMAGRGNNMTVSLAGATFVMSVDGRQMTAVIQEQIVQAHTQQGAALSNGVRPLA